MRLGKMKGMDTPRHDEQGKPLGCQTPNQNKDMGFKESIC